MKNHYRLLLYIFLMVHFQASAQKIDLKNYKPLKSEGNIPNDFISSFSKKYEEGKTQIVDEKKRSVRKSKDEFLVSSSFYLNELLRSGKVLFGDPVTNYVNDVADVLLKDFPELREQLRFYTTKSPQVNAFSTDQGIIFVNLGLIAQVENEAQLAYILAHEIIHFVKKHNMELYVYTEKMERKSNMSRRTNYEELMLNKSFRSKESEFESDREGLISYYLKTGYSPNSVNSAFDVLLYSYLPFDEVPLDKTFFETAFFRFPKDYMLDTVSGIDAEKFLTEESATHPSIDKRRGTMIDLIKEQKKDAGKEFIVSESRFREVQKIARFESVRLKIIEMRYISALYDCFLLLKENPGNRFLEISKAACLYSLSRYKTEWKTASQTTYKKIQGESQQIFYFLQKLSKKELNILALATCWRAKQKFPDSEYLKLVCTDLITDLALANKTKYSYFLTEPPSDSARVVDNVVDTVSKSKYDKIKAKQKKTGFDGDFLRTALLDFIKDTAFVAEYKRIEALRDDDEEDSEDNSSSSHYKKQKKEKKQPCQGDCIDRVVVANPFFLQYDARKAGSVRFFRTENRKEDFIEMIKNNASIAGLNADILTASAIGENETDKWNDFCFINEWMGERLEQDEMPLYPYETDFMQSTMEKYNSNYLLWNGLLAMRVKNHSLGYVAFCVTPYTIPFAIYYMLKPYYVTYYFQIFYDTNTGKSFQSSFVRSNSKYRPDLINSRIFYSLFKIKHTRKPNTK